jgi:DNA (cytosine-5)-methyltransferase 1
MTRIGSLCTGYGGLDLAVQAVFGGTVAWHCQYEPPDKDGREDKNQYAAQILTHHWPKIPNHGDLTKVDWDQVEPVDILTAGFPCQDVSLAGLRAGLTDGTRSGLWLHVARAIEALQPRLVVIENVRGLLSAKADSGMEPCTWCLGDAGGEPPLRALGAVLADLARLGFDAEWAVVRASEVGAPHQRERVFLLAWPANSDSLGRGSRPGQLGGLGAEGLVAESADTQGAGRQGAGVRGRVAERRPVAAHADGVGGERDRARGGRRHEPAPHHLTAAHPAGVGEREPADEAVAVAGSRDPREVPGGGGGAPAAHADRDTVRQQPVALAGRGGTAVAGLARADAAADSPGGSRTHGPVGDHGLQLLTEPRTGGGTGERRDTEGTDRPSESATVVGSGEHGRDNAASDAARNGRDEGRTESAGQQGRSDAALGGVTDVQWGEYEPAIRRWERVLGRPAPRPTDALGRLSPAFVEWMQGLAAGHVTSVPGIPRGAQLKALGNGVVPQQAAAALRLLASRAGVRAAA